MKEIVEREKNKQVAFMDGERDFVMVEEAKKFLKLGGGQREAMKSHAKFMKAIRKID
jgi:hypothetical protein